MYKFRSRQQGLSIIELMVALTLGLIITVGIVHIFTANRASFDLSSASSRTQESGRTALQLLARAVRNADYWGCMKGVPKDTINNILDTSGTGYSADVLGFQRGLVVEQDPSGSADGIQDGSDFIEVRGVGGGGLIGVNKQPSQSAANIHLNDTSGIAQKDILFVSDCESADVFQVTNLQNGNIVVHSSGGGAGGAGSINPGNYTQALSKKYTEEATIYRPYVQRYYISGGSLYMQEGLMKGVNAGSLGTAQQLVSGIWDMQVELGRDTNGDGSIDEWDAPKVQDNSTDTDEKYADNALALRISILTRSPDNNAVDSPQKYCFPGWQDCQANPSLLTTAGANDRHLYRVYTITAALRNRTGG